MLNEEIRDNKKRITLVSMYYPPDKNGMATYAEKLYRYLLAKKWNIKLITRKRARKKRKNIFEINIKKINIDSWRNLKITKDPRIYSLKFSKGVSELLNHQDKIIHYLVCWDDYILLYSAIRQKLINSKLLLTIGGGGVRTPKKLDNFRKEILNKANRITTLSLNAKKELVNIGMKNSEIKFTPPSIDFKRFNYIIRKRKKILNVLYLGRISREKGIFDIFKIAINAPKNFRFYIIGEGPDKNYLKRKIIISKLQNIKVLNGISHKDIPLALYKADIFLHPTYEDEFPASLLEAMATGLPCISTPVGDIPQIIINGKNGFLVNKGDIKGFIEKLEILNSFQIRKKMGKMGFKISKKYEEKKILGKFLKYYEDLK